MRQSAEAVINYELVIRVRQSVTMAEAALYEKSPVRACFKALGTVSALRLRVDKR